MTIAAEISPVELMGIVQDRYVDQYFEVALVNSPGVTYTPGSTDELLFMSQEVAPGTGGYRRQTLSFTLEDAQPYNADGVALNRKASVFEHDGGSDAINFSHAILLRGTGNAKSVLDPDLAPDAGIDGSYFNLPTITTGAGEGMTLDLFVINSGVAFEDFAVTIRDAGYGYEAGDAVQILNGTLKGVSAIPADATGVLQCEVASVSSGGGALVAIAPLSAPATLSGGNQAVFYWDIKQWGYAADPGATAP